MENLSADRVRALLNYDPETGEFRWRVARGGRPSGSIAGVVSLGYRRIRIGRLYAAHRLAWLIMTGESPVGDIDHRDRDTLNNRFSNLREATRSENNINAKKPKTNSTGFKGVSFCRPRRKWRATIQRGGTSIHLGLFATPEQAHARYCEAARQYFGDFARAS